MSIADRVARVERWVQLLSSRAECPRIIRRCGVAFAYQTGTRAKLDALKDALSSDDYLWYNRAINAAEIKIGFQLLHHPVRKSKAPSL